MKTLLAENGIPYLDENVDEKQNFVSGELNFAYAGFCAQHEKSTAPLSFLTKHSPLTERIQLFLSLFQGRADVYAHQLRGRDGKIGYSPVCKTNGLGACAESQRLSTRLVQMLPIQKAAYKSGGSVFLDENFMPYADQWTFLSSVQRINRCAKCGHVNLHSFGMEALTRSVSAHLKKSSCD